MRKPELANEFGDPNTAEYKKRQQAFSAYNKLLQSAPERLALAMGALAAGQQFSETDALTRAIRRVSDAVLTATNTGTQIGLDVDTREYTWAVIHDDPGHRSVSHAYNKLADVDKNSSEGIALRKQRGFHTLKVIALEHLEGENRKQTEVLLAQLHDVNN